MTPLETKVELPVPPLATDNIPVMSAEPLAKETAPMYREPLADLTLPNPKADNVVEPLAATVKSAAPVEYATVNSGRVWLVEDPSSTKLAVGVELLIPISYPVLLKMAEP